MHGAGADVGPDRAALEQMPLQDGGERIELGPSEVRSGDEVAADDAHAHLCRQRRDFRFHRHAVAQKEIESAAHAAARIELRFELRHARRELRRRTAAPHALGIEENLDAPLRRRRRGDEHNCSGDHQRFHRGHG